MTASPTCARHRSTPQCSSQSPRVHRATGAQLTALPPMTSSNARHHSLDPPFTARTQTTVTLISTPSTHPSSPASLTHLRRVPDEHSASRVPFAPPPALQLGTLRNIIDSTASAPTLFLQTTQLATKQVPTSNVLHVKPRYAACCAAVDTNLLWPLQLRSYPASTYTLIRS